MSHLHVPDGVLPIWLWLTGLIIAGAMIFYFTVYDEADGP